MYVCRDNTNRYSYQIPELSNNPIKIHVLTEIWFEICIIHLTTRLLKWFLKSNLHIILNSLICLSEERLSCLTVILFVWLNCHDCMNITFNSKRLFSSTISMLFGKVNNTHTYTKKIITSYRLYSVFLAPFSGDCWSHAIRNVRLIDQFLSRVLRKILTGRAI